MPDIFLSYNREDQATAGLFAAALGHAGFDVWWDATLRSGEAYDEVTEKALRDAKAVVVLWSKKSVVSRWVRAEATLADRNKTLLPVMIEPCDRPIMFELTQTAELIGWQGDAAAKAWVAFLRDVRRFVETKTAFGNPAPAITIQETAQISTLASPARTSIVVLPFANMSGDPEQEYFSDGISEDIITDLSKVSVLSVISRNSAFSFKGKNVDLPQVARRLQVTHVLEGSVRKSGNRVRITAQLIDGVTNNHLWAERYDRDLSDIFALQDEISQAIVAALKIKLFPEEKKAITERGTTNLAAYDKYLRAKALFHQGTFTDEVISLFRESLALDPKFAEARVDLMQVYLQRMVYVPEERESILTALEELAREALSNAPDHWGGHMAQSQLLFLRGDRPGGAAASARMKVLLPPSDAGALYLYAQRACALGRIAEGIQMLETARKVDPLSLLVAMQLAQYLYCVGRVVEAEAEYVRALPLQGLREPIEHFALFWTWETGDLGRTKLQFRRFLDCQHRPTPILEEVLRVIDRPAECLTLIRRAFDDPAYQDSTRIMFLSWYAARLGDTELAVAALRRCYVQMKGIFLSPLWFPFFSPIRKTPAFKQLVRDLGIYDAWRAIGQWGDFARPVGDDDFECW
jgi:adenylate cyclase